MKCGTPKQITDRILLLDGLPNYQRLFSLRVGQTMREQFEADLAIEYEVVARLRPGIIMCREKEDATTANIFEKILADEEIHIDYLETQLELMGKLGEELYLAQCVSRPPGGTAAVVRRVCVSEADTPLDFGISRTLAGEPNRRSA